MKVERTHDKLYLEENYKDNPKEYFKFIKNHMISDLKDIGIKNAFQMLDIGCETGSFLHYIRKNFPMADLSGMDIIPELLQKINDGIQGEPIKAYQADISDRKTLPSNKYDVVTMLGVLSIFDEFEEILNNTFSLVNEKGILYIFGIFNPKDIDILIKCKDCKKETIGGQAIWESGWNYFSKYSIEKYCEKKMKKCEFFPFQINIDIPEHKNDPLRSWTINSEGDKKMIINGLQLIHHFYLCKVWI